MLSNLSITDYVTITLIFWLLLECAFWAVVHFIVAPKLQNLTKPIPFKKGVNPVKFILRVVDLLDTLKTYDFKKFVKGFFCGADIDDVYVENHRRFLAWAMYASQIEDLSESQCKDLDLILKEVRWRHSFNPKPGFNPKVRHVCMTLENIPFIHRPLIVYVINGLIELIVQQIFLRALGFRSLDGPGGMRYWCNGDGVVDSAITEAIPPLLILHGITTGWALYLLLIKSVARNRMCILLDVDAIKVNSLNLDMPSPDQFAHNVKAILQLHKIAKCSVIGHSFGTITAGWLVSTHPECVSHLTLLDPVSLLLALPDVAYNFLYRNPSNLMQGLIYLVASRELTISHTLHRNFWWYRNVLWLEDVPAHIGVVVGLSGHDSIVNSASVLEYTNHCSRLRQSRQHETRNSETSKTTSSSGNSSSTSMISEITTIFWNDYVHGQILASPLALPELCEAIRMSERLPSTKKELHLLSAT